MIGHIKSHHESVETLGEGGTGVVDRAEYPRLTRFVVVKDFLPEKGTGTRSGVSPVAVSHRFGFVHIDLKQVVDQGTRPWLGEAHSFDRYRGGVLRPRKEGGGGGGQNHWRLVQPVARTGRTEESRCRPDAFCFGHC